MDISVSSFILGLLAGIAIAASVLAWALEKEVKKLREVIDVKQSEAWRHGFWKNQ